jgi:hypothetical protein
VVAIHNQAIAPQAHTTSHPAHIQITIALPQGTSLQVRINRQDTSLQVRINPLDTSLQVRTKPQGISHQGPTQATTIHTQHLLNPINHQEAPQQEPQQEPQPTSTHTMESQTTMEATMQDQDGITLPLHTCQL